MRQSVEPGMDFAYVRPRSRGLVHFLRSGGLTRFITHGLP
jgi:hypothetical protein